MKSAKKVEKVREVVAEAEAAPVRTVQCYAVWIEYGAGYRWMRVPIPLDVVLAYAVDEHGQLRSGVEAPPADLQSVTVATVTRDITRRAFTGAL